MPDFMSAASFLAILAWPEVGETATFHRVQAELSAQALNVISANDNAALGKLRAQWPQLDWADLEVRAKKRRPALGHLERRLQQRMVAAKAAIGFAHEELFGCAATLPEGLSSLTIDAMMGYVARETVIADPENVERRVWRASLPVIHLAMSTQLLLAGRYNKLVALGEHLREPVLYEDAILLAFVLERVVVAHSKFNVTRDELVRIRWWESGFCPDS